MTECFGQSATRLCSAASALLGWRPDEFWSATPAELLLAAQAPASCVDGPDRDVIEDLRRRFPDNGKQG